MLSWTDELRRIVSRRFDKFCPDKFSSVTQPTLLNHFDYLKFKFLFLIIYLNYKLASESMCVVSLHFSDD